MAAKATGSVVRTDARGGEGGALRERRTAATSACGVPGMPPGTTMTRFAVDVGTHRRPTRVEQPMQARDLTEVEDLELRHDLARCIRW